MTAISFENRQSSSFILEESGSAKKRRRRSSSGKRGEQLCILNSCVGELVQEGSWGRSLNEHICIADRSRSPSSNHRHKRFRTRSRSRSPRSRTRSRSRSRSRSRGRHSRYPRRSRSPSRSHRRDHHSSKWRHDSKHTPERLSSVVVVSSSEYVPTQAVLHIDITGELILLGIATKRQKKNVAGNSRRKFSGSKRKRRRNG